MTAPAWFRASPRHMWHYGPADMVGVRTGACGSRAAVDAEHDPHMYTCVGKQCPTCLDAAVILGPHIVDLPADVIRFVSANLGAFEAMARVAKLGGEKHGGGFGPGPGQTAEDHAAHASGHIRRDGSAYNVRTGERVWPSRDDETGELDLVHSGTRIVMALTVLGVK